MRILFVPALGALLPHLLPLIALQQKLDPVRSSAAFLVPRSHHELLRERGLRPLDIDYQEESSFKCQMLACEIFSPDILVDDLSMAAYITAKVCKLPRVGIRRTGSFPYYKSRNPNHGHTATRLRGDRLPPSWYPNIEDLFNISRPETIDQMCASDMNIVPGISEIEVLPREVESALDYVFAGSLLPPDELVPTAHHLFREVLEEFFYRHRGKKIVFFTLGTIQRSSPAVMEMVRFVLSFGFAVICNFEITYLEGVEMADVLQETFLPFHAVCSRVDLMVHHCGSGTYQYGIRYGLPSICLGSGFYDRDDVAVRLEELKVARYIAPELGSILERFCQAFEEVVSETGSWNCDARRALDILKDADENARLVFDFEAVLRRASFVYKATN